MLHARCASTQLSSFVLVIALRQLVCNCHSIQLAAVFMAVCGCGCGCGLNCLLCIPSCRQKDAASTQNVLGYRVTGFRVYTHRALDYTVGDRLYGKALTPETMPECFKTFGSNGELVCVPFVHEATHQEQGASARPGHATSFESCWACWRLSQSHQGTVTHLYGIASKAPQPACTHPCLSRDSHLR